MPIRETFWNIPHWAEITQYVLGFLTIAVFIFGVTRRIQRWRKGQPQRLTDHVGKRIWSTLVQAVGQIRTAKDPYPGIMHLSIFWGMIALFLGTALATVDWDVTHLFFNFQFLKGGIYNLYELVLDFLGLFLLVGLGMAVYRRYITKPSRLQAGATWTNILGAKLTRDDAYVLTLLVFITLTGYLVEGLRIAVTQPEWAPWSPIGNALASIFISLGDPTNQALHVTLWSAHILVAFISLGSIPFTKLFHILAAPLNIFFQTSEPAGALAPVTGEQFGVKEWTDFTWKQLLDSEACTRCGRCQDQCPAFASGATLSPRDIMIKLNAYMWHPKDGHTLHGETITAEELWACTTCMACVQVCPVFVNHVSSIVDMRRYLVNEGEIDTQLQDALANLGRYGNSFGQSDRMRARWTQPIQPKLKDARREEVEYLWFVGDYASYHASLTDITRKTAEVFQQAELNIGILYEAERNSGNDVRRVGEEGLYEMLVEKNTAALGKSQFKTIITTDPHTYNSLKNEYPKESVNGNRRILHYTELLDELICAGKIKLNKQLGLKVTYHDPCYLGRYNGIYELPRRLIEATGCQLVEMPRHAEKAFCCGAGGGRIWMEESATVKERPAENRVREAAAVPGVTILVVACPKDLVMFTDAVKTAGLEGKLEVKDVIELIAEAMEPVKTIE
jgi:Fe-S oxidoreductase/nitrate reductase gamma subunit